MSKKSPQGLDAYFERAPLVEPRRIIGRSIGEVGSGKTSWWLGATPPILVHSFDRGTEGLIQQLLTRLGLDDKEIYIKNYRKPGDQAEALDIRAEFEADFQTFVTHTERGTSLWDKETDIYFMFRMAEFGAMNTERRDEYGLIYSRYQNLIDEIKGRHLSLGIIQGMKDGWESYITRSGKEGGRPSGERIAAGCRRIWEWADLDLFHERVTTEDEKTGKKTTAYTIEVGKSHQNGELQDTKYDGFTFAQLGQLLLPGSEEEEWL